MRRTGGSCASVHCYFEGASVNGKNAQSARPCSGALTQNRRSAASVCSGHCACGRGSHRNRKCSKLSRTQRCTGSIPSTSISLGMARRCRRRGYRSRLQPLGLAQGRPCGRGGARDQGSGYAVKAAVAAEAEGAAAEAAVASFSVSGRTRPSPLLCYLTMCMCLP